MMSRRVPPVSVLVVAVASWAGAAVRVDDGEGSALLEQGSVSFQLNGVVAASRVLADEISSGEVRSHELHKHLHKLEERLHHLQKKRHRGHSPDLGPFASSEKKVDAADSKKDEEEDAASGPFAVADKAEEEGEDSVEEAKHSAEAKVDQVEQELDTSSSSKVADTKAGNFSENDDLEGAEKKIKAAQAEVRKAEADNDEDDGGENKTLTPDAGDDEGEKKIEEPNKMEGWSAASIDSHRKADEKIAAVKAEAEKVNKDADDKVKQLEAEEKKIKKLADGEVKLAEESIKKTQDAAEVKVQEHKEKMKHDKHKKKAGLSLLNSVNIRQPMTRIPLGATNDCEKEVTEEWEADKKAKAVEKKTVEDEGGM